MIEIRVDGLLAEQGRSFYWLAKETGISHTTLWRLKKGKAFGINLDTLEKICHALRCQPGDVLKMNGKKRRRSVNPLTQLTVIQHCEVGPDATIVIQE